MLHGAVLGLQDGGDSGDAAEPSPEPAEEPSSEEQLHGDQTDNGHGPQSPQKQEQSQHLHLMVEMLRPQDDIRLVRDPPKPLEGEESHPWGGGIGEGRMEPQCVCLWGPSGVRAGDILESEGVTQTLTALLELF